MTKKNSKKKKTQSGPRKKSSSSQPTMATPTPQNEDKFWPQTDDTGHPYPYPNY